MIRPAWARPRRPHRAGPLAGGAALLTQPDAPRFPAPALPLPLPSRQASRPWRFLSHAGRKARMRSGGAVPAAFACPPDPRAHRRRGEPVSTCPVCAIPCRPSAGRHVANHSSRAPCLRSPSAAARGSVWYALERRKASAPSRSATGPPSRASARATPTPIRRRGMAREGVLALGRAEGLAFIAAAMPAATRCRARMPLRHRRRTFRPPASGPSMPPTSRFGVVEAGRPSAGRPCNR